MLKKLTVLLAFVVLVVSGFSFQFGGGGSFVGYLPGDTLKLPIDFGLTFERGIFLSGGVGYGGVPGTLYSGGYGFGGELSVKKDGNDYSIVVGGGFWQGHKALNFDNFSILAGLGIGGIDITIKRKINSGNLNLSDLQNGTLEGFVETSIDYTTISASLLVEYNLGFISLFASVDGFAGYSWDGWYVVTPSRKLAGINQDDYKFLLTYILKAGIGFGF